MKPGGGGVWLLLVLPNKLALAVSKREWFGLLLCLVMGHFYCSIFYFLWSPSRIIVAYYFAYLFVSTPPPPKFLGYQMCNWE